MRNLTFAFLSITSAVIAQDHDRKIQFPDIPGYKTLVTDLHQHTVFSDGSVWPDIRISEAIFDGVDVISLTEHVEYQPHKDDIPHPDRNRSFELAKKYAEDKDLIVVNGGEITRSMPPGHSNAIFLQDANKLINDEPIDVFREANKQGAFIFWNHPNWIPQFNDGIAKMTDTHVQLIEEGLLHGIEVVNELTYSDEALAIAQQHNLTIIGTSDIHGLIDWLFDIPGGGHRPVTLVFAKEKTEASVKEALFSGRTVVWNRNNLIGNEEYLIPLIESSLQVTNPKYRNNSQVLEVTFINHSDARFVLSNQSGFTFHKHPKLIEFEPQAKTVLWVKTVEVKSSIQLSFKVLNAIKAPGQHPDIIFDITIAE